MTKNSAKWRSTEPFTPDVAWFSGYKTAHGAKPYCTICNQPLSPRKITPLIWIGQAADSGTVPIAHYKCGIRWAKKVLTHNKGVKVS